MAPRILSAYPITLYVIFGMAVVSWVIALKYFLVVNRELMRLYQQVRGTTFQGEAAEEFRLLFSSLRTQCREWRKSEGNAFMPSLVLSGFVLPGHYS